MRKKSVVKTIKGAEPNKTKKSFDVLVVLRHTRSGDERRAVIDNKGDTSVIYAMDMAEEIAQDAASAYGQGSASVFRGTLTLFGEAIPSEEVEKLSKENEKKRKERILAIRALEEPTEEMAVAGATYLDNMRNTPSRRELVRGIFKAMRSRDSR